MIERTRSRSADMLDRIGRRRDDWIAAVRAGDARAYADLVTEDVVWLPPHGAAVIGRAAFEAWLAPFFDAYAYEFSLREIQARVTDRWVAETGLFDSRMTPVAGGAPMTHTGRYFVLWRRDGDVWRIERYVDMDSLDAA